MIYRVGVLLIMVMSYPWVIAITQRRIVVMEYQCLSLVSFVVAVVAVVVGTGVSISSIRTVRNAVVVVFVVVGIPVHMP